MMKFKFFQPILPLMLVLMSTHMVAQKSTDDREIDESMRYSREKEFNKWAASVGFGPMIMYSDITRYVMFPDTKWKFGTNVMVSRQLGPVFALDAQWLTGNTYGQKGNFYFEGNIMDFTLSGVIFINQLFAQPGPVNDRWDFYVKAGAGVTAFRSRLHHVNDGSIVKEGYFTGKPSDENAVVLGYDLEDPGKKTARKLEVIVPLGVGTLYRVNERIDLGLEMSYRYCLEDNMDNILTGSLNDRYFYTSFNLAYKFGKKNTRHVRWTYRSYGFNIFGAKKKDPLVDEVRILEQQIQQFADNRPIKRDTVVIVNNLKRVYGEGNVFPVFFEGLSEKVNVEAQVQLAEIALKLVRNKEWKLELVGHTDAMGDAGLNLQRSQKRCEAVKEYLVVEMGINSERISFSPKGSSELLSPTDQLTPRGIHLANRRVDVVIIK
jgi:hypothetical protein